jgi:hypothetical protein
VGKAENIWKEKEHCSPWHHNCHGPEGGLQKHVEPNVLGEKRRVRRDFYQPKSPNLLDTVVLLKSAFILKSNISIGW